MFNSRNEFVNIDKYNSIERSERKLKQPLIEIGQNSLS